MRFADLLQGAPYTPPKGRVRKFINMRSYEPGTRVKAVGATNQERRSHTENAILAAVRAGHSKIKDIALAANVSDTCTARRLESLTYDGLLRCEFVPARGGKARHYFIKEPA